MNNKKSGFKTVAIFGIAAIAFVAVATEGSFFPSLWSVPTRQVGDFDSRLLKALSEPAVRAALLDAMKLAVEDRNILSTLDDFRRGMKEPLPVSVDGRIALGRADAPVTVVEYQSFQCSACAAVSAALAQVMKRHQNDIKVILKHLPHDDVTRREALYYEALLRQDPDAAKAFMQFAFSNAAKIRQDIGAIDLFVDALESLDRNRFDRDVASNELAATIDADIAEAIKHGFKGVPVFLVGGVPLRGAVPERVLSEAIAMIRGAAKSAPRAVEG